MLHGLLGCRWHKTLDSEPVFRFAILSEPQGLDPLDNAQSLQSYFLAALYSPLLQFKDGELSSGLAEKCRFVDPTHVECVLRPGLRFSDGTLIVANHVVQTFHAMFTRRSHHTESFAGLSGAKVALRGSNLATLGVTAPAPHRVMFQLDSPDSEFLFRLTDPCVTPRRDEQLDGTVTTGPYVLDTESDQRGRFRLKPNPFYDGDHQLRPPIEILLAESDFAARNLFDAGQINFLRRLTADGIEKYRSHPGFLQVPLERMDYIGLNSAKLNLAERRALLRAPAYVELQQLLSALGRPGCPSLSEKFFDQYPCLPLKEKRAEKSQVLPEKISFSHRLLYGFAIAAGDDIQRQAEWFQAQWKSKLAVEIELQGFESKHYLGQLNQDPPHLFRRGYPLNRPTCLSALEDFSENSQENFVKNRDPEFQKLLKSLATTHEAEKQRKICRLAFERLLDQALIIPLGQIHFSMISDQKFDGFTINSLNQIDFGGLRLKKP